ncbi:Hpt domain-containing protein [Sulfitobacter sp. S190]|uniref:Hpt domain-containing protein n=1 Tax=Sulfitobacter sp. S190 TaxID=2867022 RepID=UPI0021A7D83D|nr:Hpt domain-containing protein [Sulfitobacter sp. S190]UWR21933.1 Hpt domain-containing protein [Sulfitobacter sp. S190]
MNAVALELPGLDRIRARFVDMLDERQSTIAQHALNAWDGETVEQINGNLEAAKGILHQIAGTAGTVGFQDLGQSAHECEVEIINHLEGPYADLAICPGEIIWRIDSFVAACAQIKE